MDRHGNSLRLYLFLLVMLAACSGWPQAVVDSTPAVRPLSSSVSSHSAFSASLSSNVVIPQIGAFASRAEDRILITDIKANIKILEQTATTVLQVQLRNPSSRRQEAELVVPVPSGAVVSGFAFNGSAKEATAQVLPRDEGRAIYDRIVSGMRDPALLEFVGFNIIRSSVFPVEAGGEQTVRLTYEQVLSRDGARIDYILPRSETPTSVVPWEITALVHSKDPISTVYSPTHQLIVDQKKPGQVVARVAEAARREPGPFRLSCLMERETITASLMAYPDSKIGGGYFLLLAGLPARIASRNDAPSIKRDVTFVLDHSGSMSGEKIEQARDAALQVFEGLQDGEYFNLVVYNDTVDRFSDQSVQVSAETRAQVRQYLKGIGANGGTNLHDALNESLRIAPQSEMLPLVLFLTDGLPTVGQTSETAIRELAVRANPHHRRIFTFGVGADVNAPLLDALSGDTKGSATYVLPGEDVEVKVSQVFSRLAGPVLADATLELIDENGASTPDRVRELMPAKLPDLFEGDQLVMLGQYRGEEPLHFQLKGNCLGKERTFRFDFQLDKATTKNAFVPRLWASRKIAALVDEVRRLGADGRTDPTTDPAVKELADAILKLSKDFGILTEYTAFLAREGTDLGNMQNLLAQTNTNLDQLGMRQRSGMNAISQSMNNMGKMSQSALNKSNTIYTENMERVAFSNVAQVADQTFYLQNGVWTDARALDANKPQAPVREIQFGSDEYNELAKTLADQGRQGSLALGKDLLIQVDHQGKEELVRIK